MARGVHAGAVSAVAGPGDAGGRELHLERWCGWSGLGGRPTPGRSGCLGGPRGLRVGAAPPVEARSRVGGYLQKIGAPRSSLAGTCGCLGADLLHRPRRCAYAGPGAAGCGANGAARSRQLLCSQIGSGLCAKGQVETEESQMGGPAGREREDVGASRGAGPWLLWPPLTPSPRCWGPQPSPLLPGLRHEAELGPDTTVHLPERPGHSRGGRGQTEAADRGQEASGSLSHQVEKGRCLAHALYGYSLLLTPQAVHEQAVTLYPRLCPFKDNGHHQCCGDQFGGESSCGKLEDGTEFDSSLPQNQPFVFSLGTGQVIKGWDQGLLGMCEGEKRKLVIPSELGYGERGAPPKIPGGATLVFEVELLKIERRSEL